MGIFSCASLHEFYEIALLTLVNKVGSMHVRSLRPVARYAPRLLKVWNVTQLQA